MSSSEQSPFTCALVGADSLLVECGEILQGRGHTISVVASGSPRVASWAASKGIPVVDATGPAASWAPALGEHAFGWLFAITHLAILPDEVLALPAEGAINFHDGPLPAYAGLNTPAWALMRGETTYGITWHRITSGIDEGDVVASRTFDVAPGETSLSLNTRNFEAAIESFGELVDDIAGGTLTDTPQDRSVPGATFSKHDRPPAMAVLDWRRPAAELDALVRALTFGPYPNPLGSPSVWVGDEVALVTEVAVVDDDGEPGSVLEAGDDRLVVACGEGALALTGLTTPTGGELAVGSLVAAAGLAEGGALPVLDDATVAALDELAGRLSRAEARHLRALEALEPVELPWARTPGAEHRPSFASIDLAVPAALADDAGPVTAAFAATVTRLAGKARGHLGLVVPSPSEAPASALVAPAVPFEVALDGSEPLGAAVEALSGRLATARAGAGLSWDRIAGHPALTAVPELRAGRLVPVGVRIDVAGDPLPGVTAELRHGPTGWEVRYDEALVDADDAALLRSCVEAVLASVASDPTGPVGEVDLLGPALRTEVLEEWNDTVRPSRDDVCLHQLVEEQADRTPDVAAVVFEDASITYRELDERANRLAHHLLGLGIGPDAMVGVHVTRGIDLVVAVVAVHKAGGGYVPLDPAYPHDRLEHMIRDSGCPVVVTESAVAGSLPIPEGSQVTVVSIDGDRDALAALPADRPDAPARSDALAYCIYTSGSTGLPKGVLVEHRNVVNFFEGMDEVVPHDLPATWFAVTSLSFDISVLELLYTLTRGFTVVVYLDRDRADDAGEERERHAAVPMDFSLFYFSGDEAAEGTGPSKYRLLLEGARFADTHGFKAVWTPERHFHAFGGLYPQPAVTGAAVAAITENVEIRAGSVVMPLHHPIRVAEAWSVVDNISNGRVAVSIAAGWQPNDFVLMPENYANAKQAMFDGIEVVQRLWKGEEVTFDGPKGDPVTVRTLPRPVQPELPVWVTTAGNPETYIQAGRLGANVLTHLLGQSVEQLGPKIEAYRKARAEAGFDPDAGVVSLMLHTFVGDDEEAVRATVREPLKQYLATSFSLLKEYAWAFPAFQRPAGAEAADDLADEDFKNLTDEDLDAVLEFAYLRYYDSSGLFGTPETCRRMVDSLKGIGVDEIACLIDFGIGTDTVLESLPTLARVLEQSNAGVGRTGAEAPAADQSVAAQLTRHRVTHMQCTPSMARMLSLQDESRRALADVENLFVGGEAFPVALGKDLLGASASGRVTNMYGPTETTIWSTTWGLEGDLDAIPIGRPIANTRIYILDAHHQPVPPGVAGELWIGGRGVVRGYHERPELTAERFVTDPFLGDGHRMYLTGDLARWRRTPDGPLIEFLGRADHQVKIRGYRIELGEIEAQLGRVPGVRECVAVVREDTPGDQQLVAYVSTAAGVTVDPAAVKDHLRETLPDVMIPGHVAVLADLPHTPNGKIDRNALPTLAEVLGTRVRTAAPVEAGNDLERQVLAVWEETLGADGIGVDDNFFDIGGHSLLVVRMHRKLKEVLDRAIPLTDLYRYPTIRSFAEALSSDTSGAMLDASRDRAARRREATSRRRVRR